MPFHCKTRVIITSNCSKPEEGVCSVLCIILVHFYCKTRVIITSNSSKPEITFCSCSTPQLSLKVRGEPKTIYKYRVRKLNMGIISNMILDHIAKRRRLEARNLRNSYSYFNFHSLYNTLRTKRVVVSGPKSFRDVRETQPRRSLYSHWRCERG